MQIHLVRHRQFGHVHRLWIKIHLHKRRVDLTKLSTGDVAFSAGN